MLPKMISIEKLIPYTNNPVIHNEDEIEYLKKTISEYGFLSSLVVDKDNVIVAGHARYEASKRLGIKELSCFSAEHLTEAQVKKFRIIDNKISEMRTWDPEALKIELSELKKLNVEINEFKFDEIEKLEDVKRLADLYGNATDENKGNLNNLYLYSPFSVIRSAEGNWLELKNKWKTLFDSKLGRKESLIGKSYGTSEFDGAICEVMYKWFKPKEIDKMNVLDSFCGGVVRGAVTEILGHNYNGFEIRKEQVDINKKQSKEIGVNPKFINDDALNIDKHIEDLSQDIILSCPPYGDLEVYSDLENDISNMGYDEFIKVYKEIIKRHCKKLKENRFAIYVVGDVRDTKGEYRNFIGDTINAFKEAGLIYYNNVIYIEPYGTAPLRANNTFKNRKLVKVHQNILIFYKGDTREIQKHYEQFNISE